MPLKMKYFIVKPGSKKPGDLHAIASRAALRAYAAEIRHCDGTLAVELEQWADREMNLDAQLQRDRRLALDHVAIFVEECCVRMVSAFVGMDRLYQAYLEWCGNFEVQPGSRKNFAERIRKMGFRFNRDCTKKISVQGLILSEDVVRQAAPRPREEERQ